MGEHPTETFLWKAVVLGGEEWIDGVTIDARDTSEKVRGDWVVISTRSVSGNTVTRFDTGYGVLFEETTEPGGRRTRLERVE